MNNRIRETIALALAFLLVPLTALAADAAPAVQQWWEVLVANLVEVVVGIAVPVLTTLVVVLANKWKVKLQYETVYDLAHKGAGWAEQLALKKLKNGEPTSSAEKLEAALKFARELAEQQKLPAKATAKLQDLIESALGQKQLDAAGDVVVLDGGTEPEAK